jgi:N-acetyl-anhydromuramyl-L-alanine amidase AmpD
MGLGKPGAGGGSIVFATGSEAGGVGVDTLLGDHLVAPAEQALCPVTPQRMRICPSDESLDRAVVADATFVADGSAPRGGTIARGTPVTLLEYVSGGGATRALVDIGGIARFLPAAEICHAEAIPEVSPATTHLAMDRSAPGGPKSFRPRSPAAIRRIVIHNTEVPLLQTLLHFGRADANTSAHVVVDRDGSYYRVIEDQFTAFHAGASKDGLGGHNATSLGIEVVAYKDAKYGGESGKFGFFSDVQRAAVIKLVDFWMNAYALEIDPEVMANRAATPGYADLEYRGAALTIHRLTKADRGTDCPRLLFPQSSEGDEEFFRWRETTFAPGARVARSAGRP